MAVVAISLAGLAMLRGAKHIEAHLDHRGGIASRDGSMQRGSSHTQDSRHLGLLHPDRDKTMVHSPRAVTRFFRRPQQGTEISTDTSEAHQSSAEALDVRENVVQEHSETEANAQTSTTASKNLVLPAGSALDKAFDVAPERDSADWDSYHAAMRLRKHEQNKKRRQFEKAAIGATIAASKVAAVSMHLNSGPEGMESMMQNMRKVNGAYKFTGSGALGDKQARLAAAAYLNATKVTTLEQLDAVIAELAEEGQLTADVNSMGPADTGYSVDDDSSCRGSCGRMGFCRAHLCECVVLYEGRHCEVPREMPDGMHAQFDGNFIFNRARIRDLPDLMMKYTTNPKASGGTHSFALPVTRDMIRLSPARDPLETRIYERCAIIGSSGILNHYYFGNDIDASSLVIRFNLAPSKDYRDHVGERTTLRFVNTVHAGYHESSEIGVMQMQSQVGLQLYLKFRRDHPTERIIAFDTEFSQFVSSNVRTLPTGGYFAIWLGLTRCKNVNIYGFNFASGYGVPHHYFNEEKPKKGNKAIHDYELEHELIVKLASAGFAHFAEPCVAGCTERTGIRYANLAPGGTCQCDTGNPLPVALPGFCRPPGTFMCFVKCPGGSVQCAGGVYLAVRMHDAFWLSLLNNFLNDWHSVYLQDCLLISSFEVSMVSNQSQQFMFGVYTQIANGMHELHEFDLSTNPYCW